MAVADIKIAVMHLIKSTHTISNRVHVNLGVVGAAFSEP